MNLVVFLFIVLFNYSGNINTQSISAVGTFEYMLVWSDEFNIAGSPDTTKWRFEHGFVRNNEAQWYQKEKAVCAGGYLTITGKKQNRPNPDYLQGSTYWKTNRENIEYTSSSVKMKKDHAFQYGKIEVRAKIDAQTGLWPAIWTLGVSGEWPSDGEEDIMEYYYDRILANFAYADHKRYSAFWNAASIKLDSLGGRKWADEFHIWTLLWDEHKMEIFVDELMLNSIDLHTSINKSDNKNPFKQTHCLLLNLAMGGNRGGNLENTKLSSEYLIDYVRIYQKKQS